MKTRDLSNAELVTLAVAILGGELDFVDPEDVAVKCDELLPGHFAWRRYRDRIDLVKVRVALLDAKKERCGALLTGDNANGFLLTPAGANWVRTLHLNEDQAVDALGKSVRVADGQHLIESSRLRSERATLLHSEGRSDDITVQDAYAFARINEYFQRRARMRRVAIIEHCVSSDKQLSEVWAFLSLSFPEVFHDKT